MPLLQAELPPVQRAAAGLRLPGMQPVGGPDWITVDDAYAGQMAEKARLLGRRDLVIQMRPTARAAAAEALEVVLTLLAARPDFALEGERVHRPDGHAVSVDLTDPLGTLARLLQEDICILQAGTDGHVLEAASLCFPAGWTLSEKIGRPLLRIHRPVPEYGPDLAARVQRLFDGIKPGVPIWRANLLRYHDPALFQPLLEDGPRRPDREGGPYERSERQTLFRLPRTGAVVFAIHTRVTRA